MRSSTPGVTSTRRSLGTESNATLPVCGDTLTSIIVSEWGCEPSGSSGRRSTPRTSTLSDSAEAFGGSSGAGLSGAWRVGSLSEDAPAPRVVSGAGAPVFSAKVAVDRTSPTLTAEWLGSEPPPTWKNIPTEYQIPKESPTRAATAISRLLRYCARRFRRRAARALSSSLCSTLTTTPPAGKCTIRPQVGHLSTITALRYGKSKASEPRLLRDAEPQSSQGISAVPVWSKGYRP